MTSSAAAGQIITFYSYKGGTGRSMALANVAYILGGAVQEGQPGILMIDWDLEAPGLHRFFPSHDEGSSEAARHEGLIDFFEAADHQYRLAASTIQENDDDPFATVRQSIIASFKSYESRTGAPHVTLVRAGRLDDRYPEKVRKFDWEGFHHRDPRFFIDFRKYLASRYTVVLLDSRTGLTDTSGICARQMPDKLVLVFIPNHQNIEGVLDVATKVRDFRIADSTDTRPLSIFPLASRIDATASRRLNIWRRGGIFDDQPVKGYQPAFEELLTELYELDECHLDAYFDATQLNHDSDYAFGESIAARHGTTDRLTLGFAYANLARRVTGLFGPWELLPDERAVEEARLKEAAAQARAETAQAVVTRTRRWGLLLATSTAVISLISVGFVVYFARSSSQAEAEQPLIAVRASEDPLEQALVLARLDPDRQPSESAVAFARTVAREPLPAALLKRHTGRILQVQFDQGSEKVLTLSSAAAIVQSANGKGLATEITLGAAGASIVAAAIDSKAQRLVTLAFPSDVAGTRLLQLRDISNQARAPVVIQEEPSNGVGPPVGFLADGTPMVVWDQDAFRAWEKDGWDYWFFVPQKFDASLAVIASSGQNVAIPVRRGRLSGAADQSTPRRAPSAPASVDRPFVGIWDLVESGRPDERLIGPLSGSAFALSTNGLYVADASGNLWDTSSQRQVHAGSAPVAQGADSLAVSSNGRWFAWGGVAGVTLVSVGPDPIGTRVLRGHRAAVVSMAFSSDDQLLVTGSSDGEVRVWRVQTDSPSETTTWSDLVRYFRTTTIACLTIDQHIRLLSATEAAARAEVERCELANQGATKPPN